MTGWRRVETEDGLTTEERAALRKRQSELRDRLRQIKQDQEESVEAFAEANGYDLDEIKDRLDARDAFRSTDAGKDFQEREETVRAALAEATNASKGYIKEFRVNPEGDHAQGEPPVILQRERRRTNSLSSSTRETVLERDGHECLRCGLGDDLEIHHIVPHSRGGSNEVENLATLCSDCHTDATLTRSFRGEVPAYPPDEFEAWLQDDLDICAARTTVGTRCRNPARSCPHHG